MADYRLTQSGDQVQEILNNAAMQSDLTAEQERAELAEQTLQNNIDAEALAREQADGVLDGKIDANTTRIVNIEGKIPSGASTENKLTTESEMNSAIATATATFRGTYNLVSDLGLAVSATHEQIATALAGEIATADNNDYCFVQVPTSESTPTQIAKIERYKFNGTAWAFEYELNNSGFTAEQWAAINSGITASQVAALPGMSQAIEAILVLIPSAASALNQLADKAFVNSSVSTNTATFRGTFNLITDLNLSLDATRAQIAAALLVAAPTADNNDYAFVQIPTSAQTLTEISATERYKFNGTAWAYEYSLNTSGFTAQQWNAINSGITSALVTLLGQIIPSAATASNQLADKAYVLAQILAAIPSFKGQFTTLADLQAVASPKAGDLGIVRTTDSDGFATFTFYQYLNSAWNVFYTLAHHLQNKPATTGTTGDYPYNGMGRVVLPMNIKEIDGVTANYLEQSMMPTATGGNTIYVITHDYVLATDITIPANCVLEFEGGSISLGEYNFSGTTLNESLTPEDFGAKGDGITDDRKAIQAAINLSKTIILDGDYLVQNAPFDWTNYDPIPTDEADYFMDVLAQKNSTPDSSLTPLIIGEKKTIILRGKIKAYSPLGNLIEITGDNNVIKGGGIIEGSGIVCSINVYSGTPVYEVTGWEAANILIRNASNNVIEGVTIKNPTNAGINIYGYDSRHNIIENCIIGGGLTNHTEEIANVCSFSALFGIYSRGCGTVVKNNVFKRLDGKTVYDALYCNYTDAGTIPDIEERDIPHTLFENNIIEDVLEHGIYSYAQRLVIKNNTFKKTYATCLQLFNGYNFIENNIINVFTSNSKYCNNAMMLSGEHQIVKSNKIYNCTGFGIRCQGYYNGSCDYDIVENNYIEVDLNGKFSAENTDHLPTITFESTDYADNKTVIDNISCINNTIVCKNDAHGRNTPIRGFIAVFGSANTTFKNIDIINNTVVGTCAQDLIYIELENTTRNSYANIVGNVCLASGVLTAVTRYDCVIGAIGLKTVNISNNQIKHLAEYDGLANAGYILQLDNDYNIIDSNVMEGQALSNRNWLNVSSGNIISVSSNNIIGGIMLEQVFTISNGTNDTNVSFQHGNNVPFYAEIIPLNNYAKELEKTDPCLITNVQTDYVSIVHTNNVSEDAVYKLKVIFYLS